MTLQTQSPDELRAILTSLGGKARKDAKPAVLIKRIQQLQSPIPAFTQLEPEKPSVAPPTSQDAIVEAVASNIQNGMEVKFIDSCWEFKKGLRMDSGTIHQPLYNIKKAADMVTQLSISAARLGL